MNTTDPFSGKISTRISGTVQKSITPPQTAAQSQLRWPDSLLAGINTGRLHPEYRPVYLYIFNSHFGSDQRFIQFRDIFHACLLRIARSAGIIISRLCQEGNILLFHDIL